MKSYIKPSGAYIEYPDYLPHSEDWVECYPRPSTNHVVNGSWASSPMNPEVCWRLKTSQEIDSEKQEQAIKTIDLSPLDKTIFKQIFLIRKALTPALTLAQFRQDLIDDYKGFL